ncbi:MAG: pyridoxamine 5'-phosphate oxidase family protein [Ilumatobacteraceae bacterium]
MGEVGLAWRDVERLASPLASAAASRFAAHEHHVMATVQADGRPRVSGTNIYITDGTMWLGMMPAAARRHDLDARPWCSVHSAPLNAELPHGEGDVRLDADVRRLDDDVSRRLLHAIGRGDDSVTGVFVELLIRSMSLVEVDGAELVVTSWSPSRGIATRRLS